MRSIQARRAQTASSSILLQSHQEHKTYGGGQSIGIRDAMILISSFVCVLSFLQFSHTFCSNSRLSPFLMENESKGVSGSAVSEQFFRSQIFLLTSCSTNADNFSAEKSSSLLFAALLSALLSTWVPFGIFQCMILSDDKMILSLG